MSNSEFDRNGVDKSGIHMINIMRLKYHVYYHMFNIMCLIYYVYYNVFNKRLLLNAY